jgi:ABC transporter substrate binding protein
MGRQATASIPIIITAANDPVAAGFSTSLSRPRSNITGLTIQSSDLVGKTFAGWLISYGVPLSDQLRRTADFVTGSLGEPSRPTFPSSSRRSSTS